MILKLFNLYLLMKILIVQGMWVNQTIEIIEIIKLLIEEKKKEKK